MSFLANKRILFIAPSFHNLQFKILNEMIELGAEVDYYDERPKNNFLTKFLIRLKLKIIIAKQIYNYYKNILLETRKKHYDYVFFINIEAINEKILYKFREQNKDSIFILYMWDSLELKKISDKMLSFFDRKFTFDYRDAKNRNMQLLDLFYTKEYKNTKMKIKYDISFIGTIHGDRYKILKEIKEKAEKQDLKVYYYLYMPSRIMFWGRKIFDRRFKGLKYSDVQFDSLDSHRIVEIMNQSKAIVDLSYKNQVGLSMRTFEVLGVKKKLITTHQMVKDYDFYDKNNIEIIEKNNIKINKSFLEIKYNILNENVYKKYSLYNWLKKIIMS
jgi:hypothetical protein